MEFIYQPLDRLSLRPRVGFGWRTADVSLTLGANAAFHFRPGKRWRPFVSGGFTWEDRHAPPPAARFGERCCEITFHPAPASADRNVWQFSGSVGVERAFSRRGAFVAEVEFANHSYLSDHFRWNGNNWQTSWSGNPLTLGVGFTFNLTPGRKESAK